MLACPMCQALVGLELLLARSQTWEENAARHVSIAPQLDTISKYATAAPSPEHMNHAVCFWFKPVKRFVVRVFVQSR
jgi:hypothetical protein